MIPPKKRILIVDPSPASLVWQLVLLQEERYDTLTATQADEGIRIATMEQPDLILLDVASSPADGLAACRTLRTASETSDIPILVITSNGFGSGLSRAEVGFDERITRPFDGVEYLTKIRRCLERPVRRA